MFLYGDVEEISSDFIFYDCMIFDDLGYEIFSWKIPYT